MHTSATPHHALFPTEYPLLHGASLSATGILDFADRATNSYVVAAASVTKSFTMQKQIQTLFDLAGTERRREVLSPDHLPVLTRACLALMKGASTIPCDVTHTTTPHLIPLVTTHDHKRPQTTSPSQITKSHNRNHAIKRRKPTDLRRWRSAQQERFGARQGREIRRGCEEQPRGQ